MATRFRNCDWCFENYAYERSSSRFCSTSCRVMAAQHGDRVFHMLKRVATLFSDLHAAIDAHPDTLYDGKFLEATAHLVIESTNLDQHLLKATAKGISQNILIDFHK